MFVVLVCNLIFHSRIEESPQSPKATKVSEIADRKQKLKAYRLQKNTEKFKQIQEQRSPFIVAVPVGRWVEKKEKGRQIDFNMNATPVRKALINERVLKKSTIKNLIAKSTAKKENAFTFVAKAAKPEAKSKKKILGELNAAPAIPRVESADGDLMPLESFDLNSTFEISPASPEKEVEPVKPLRQLRRSTSLPEIAKKIKHDVKKKPGTPPAKPVAAKKAQVVLKPKPVMKAQITKPVVVKRPAAKTDSNFRIAKPAVHEKLVPAAHKKHVPAAVKKTVAKAPEKCVATAPEAPSIVPRAEAQNEPPAVQPKKTAKPEDSARLVTYNIYKIAMDTQIKYLTMKIKDISSNNEAFLATLSEDQQMSVHEILNQGKVFISEDVTKFGAVLEAFKLAEDSTGITDEDIENQWYRVYDEIEKLKVSLSEILLMKEHALSSLEKRRTRRIYVPDEGTPKRSKRIADNADTPK